MNDKDKDLKSALDDIFGSDFIEIDLNKQDKKEGLDIEENFDKENIIDSNEENVSKTNNNIEGNEEVITTQTSQVTADNMQNEAENVKEEEVKKNRLKPFIIALIIVLVIGLVLAYIIINHVVGTTKVVNCSIEAEDTGYKYSDEYKITYKKDEINYIESVYIYTALNDEYKVQIEYIKEDKLPVIINSNGMSGFTYIYETSEDAFKVNGYLDFSLFEFDKIDKINQDLMPISYFKINSKTTFESLKKSLEKQGYKCVLSN